VEVSAKSSELGFISSLKKEKLKIPHPPKPKIYRSALIRQRNLSQLVEEALKPRTPGPTKRIGKQGILRPGITH